MVQKRPFDEELYGFSCKLPKQSKHDDSQSLFSDFINSEDNASDIVDSIGWKRKFEMEENLYEKNCYFSDDYVRMDKPSSFPEFYFPERSGRTVPRHEDTYSVLLQQHPQKLVPLGPDHQADIPPWNSSKAIVDNVKKCVVQDEGDELSGITVIPMPDSDSSECKVGAGRSNCWCTDKGSVRCVRQHIKESREKLEKSIGSDAFEGLGFLEMGEAVAEKQWTEDEERMFHQIVSSYPISMGKSFWSRLSSVFPYRAKQEIVSYYFNVFILRVRTEQNRFDPSGADSDNDEWCLSDDEDEDDDSGVESHVHQFGFVSNTINDEELESDEGCDDGAGKTWGAAAAAAYGKNGSDDSCTSFDSDATVPGPHLKNNDLLWDYSGDAKLWDVGYMSYQKKEADFLPTCSMIEQVFGDDDSWNFKVEDGKGL